MDYDGNLLRRIRKNKRMTIDQLAKRSGISKATIQRYETGQSAPPMSMLTYLAQALDTSVLVLLGYESDNLRRDNLDDLQSILLTIGYDLEYIENLEQYALFKVEDMQTADGDECEDILKDPNFPKVLLQDKEVEILSSTIKSFLKFSINEISKKH